MTVAESDLATLTERLGEALASVDLCWDLLRYGRVVSGRGRSPEDLVAEVGSWRALIEKIEKERADLFASCEAAEAKAARLTANLAAAQGDAYRAGRDRDKRMEELRAIAKHLGCGHGVEAVKEAVDEVRAERDEARAALNASPSHPARGPIASAAGEAEPVTTPARFKVGDEVRAVIEGNVREVDGPYYRIAVKYKNGSTDAVYVDGEHVGARPRGAS